MLAARIVTGILVSVAVLGQIEPAEAQAGRLTGKWELRDRATFDSVAAASELESEDTFQRPPPDSAAGGPGGRAGPRGPRRMTDSERFQIGLLLGMASVVPAFEVDASDSAVVITNEDGFTYTVYPGGPKTVLALTDEVSVEVEADWEDGALIVEFKPDGGGKLTESYFLADSGLYLRLEVTVEHGRLPREVWRTRMYRRVEE